MESIRLVNRAHKVRKDHKTVHRVRKVHKLVHKARTDHKVHRVQHRGHMNKIRQLAIQLGSKGIHRDL